MAFTEVARLATTTARVAALSATNTYTLPSAPASGQWIVVALYTNQGIIPTGAITGANNLVTSVTCGSISLSVLEGSTNTSLQEPTVYAAPYASGMTTTLSVTWTNGIAATTLGVAVLIFSGASTTTGSMTFREGNGAFDGAGNTTFGATGAQGSSGVITWANSNNAIPTNYDSQQQPFIAAIVDTNVPTSTTLQLARSAGLFGVVSNSSGQLSQFGGTAGTLPISSGTSVYNPAGGTAYGVIYGTYGNFTFSYTGVSGNNLTGCVATGLGIFAQAPSYAPIMLAGTSAVTITAILNTNSPTTPNLNGFLTGSTSYTSGTASANGHVQIGMGGTGTVPARLHLIGGSNNAGYVKQTAYAVQRINGSVLTNGGGFIYTFAPATRTLTRTSTAVRTLISRVVKVREKIAVAVFVRTPYAVRQVASVRTAKAVLTRTSTALKAVATFRTSVANALRIPLVAKTRASQRVSAASQANVASVTRTRQSVRRANVSVTYTIASTKRRTFVRRAVATSVLIARSISKVLTISRAGTVTGDFKIAGGRAAFKTGQLEGTFDTANVVGSQKKTGQI